jgi:hypothetical protein
VVFFPSFHAEAIVQVTRSSNTELRFTTLSSSMWHSFNGMSESGHGPERVTERVILAQSQTEKIWSQIEHLQPQSIESGTDVGLDGMSIDAAYSTPATTHSFTTWGPTEDSPLGAFVVSLYELAWETLKDDVSIERLEQLHGYLHLGLPCRVINESPRRLRLFGGLSSGHEKELRDFFKAFPSDEPLVIDMSNFEGMGTILYPLFVEFANAHKQLAWFGSPNAVRHLHEMGIQETTICNSISEACQAVRKL